MSQPDPSQPAPSLDRARELARRVEESTRRLAAEAPLLDPPPLESEPWFRTLTTKVRPQLEEGRFLIVAVVGGTNIGKSAVFNHIAGEHASKIDRNAAGTKHPVLIVPDGFAADRLAALFPGFDLAPWTRDEEPVEASDRDKLFWRSSTATPDNLLVLDTPDVDSDREVNWERADRIRRAADLLVCVLTQQKYNDRAVKDFFRRAAAEGKQTVVVFNQILLPEDEDIWPDWVGRFCEETGLDPSRVYLAPHDRRAVEELRLPFYPRQWPAEPIGERSGEPVRLLDELSAMHFDEIKLETMRGALRQVGREAPRWLEAVRAASGEMQDAASQLADQKLADRVAWPPLPQSLMTSELMAWWRAQREAGWTRTVHGLYSGAGELITKPFRMLQSDREPPIEAYRRREWDEGVQPAIRQVFERLQSLRKTGHERLEPGLDRLLTADSRAALRDRLQQEHREHDLADELSDLVTEEMNAFRESEAKLHTLMRNVDKATAIARPLVTLGLVATGVGIGGVAGISAAGTVGHLASDVVGGAAVGAAGETVIGKLGKDLSGKLQAQMQSLHDKFVARRLAWLTTQIDDWLGDFPTEIVRAADIAQTEAFGEAEAAVAALDRFAGSLGQ